MLKVATVLKSGGKYDALWVDRLRVQVARHLHEPHEFVCFSDVDVRCTRIPLAHNWPGWWSKIELFKLDGPVLYFDLDTLIVADLEDIAASAKKFQFIALRDFYRLGAGLGSGVMAWSESAAYLYDTFANDPDRWMKWLGGRGDQGFIEQALYPPGLVRWQDLVDDQIVSYKVHCQKGKPDNARVVCLHGRPKFPDMPEKSWARTIWEQAI